MPEVRHEVAQPLPAANVKHVPDSTVLGTQGDGELRQSAPGRVRTAAGRVGPRSPGLRARACVRACERASKGLPGLGAWSARARPCVRLREAACARGAAASAAGQPVWSGLGAARGR